MSEITGHWSASPPERLNAYHVEFALTGSLSEDVMHELRALKNAGGYSPTGFPWDTIRPQFTIWKNDSFTTSTDYGTWDNNNDPRDDSPNIEVAAMCMGGSDVSVESNWGKWPYTIAHAWMHAGIIARICALKDIDANESFPASVEPSVLQNGPIYVVSTHGERATQTQNWGVPGAAAASLAQSQEFGYFAGSGDPNSREDLFLLDVTYLAPGAVTVANAKASAAWLREQAHLIKAAGISDYWGLNA